MFQVWFKNRRAKCRQQVKQQQAQQQNGESKPTSTRQSKSKTMDKAPAIRESSPTSLPSTGLAYSSKPAPHPTSTTPTHSPFTSGLLHYYCVLLSVHQMYSPYSNHFYMTHISQINNYHLVIRFLKGSGLQPYHLSFPVHVSFNSECPNSTGQHFPATSMKIYFFFHFLVFYPPFIQLVFYHLP